MDTWDESDVSAWLTAIGKKKVNPSLSTIRNLFSFLFFYLLLSTHVVSLLKPVWNRAYERRKEKGLRSREESKSEQMSFFSFPFTLTSYFLSLSLSDLYNSMSLHS
jgi:hypothetical protein